MYAGKPQSDRSKSPVPGKRAALSPRPGGRKSAVEQAPPMPMRSPRPGGKRVSAPTATTATATPSYNAKKEEYHDPMEVFERVMKEEFGAKYKEKEESGWKGGKGWFGGNNNKKIVAKAADKNNLNAVVAMETSTKKEARKDGRVEIKTITKIVRADGTIEKVVQTSVADKDVAKSLPKNDKMTMSREK
jgi:hypothetical protein